MAKPRVGLFITCLADQFFPQVGECVVKILQRLDVEVTFNPKQTCCGQPAFNTGYRDEARSVARKVLDLYDNADYVVAPSGSCTSMVRVFYPELFLDDPVLLRKSQDLQKRFFEFSEFLVKVLKVDDLGRALSPPRDLSRFVPSVARTRGGRSAAPTAAQSAGH